MTTTDAINQLYAQYVVPKKPVDVDKEFGPQCWDLVELFAELCGVPKEPWAVTLGPNGYAYEAWTVFDGHMQRNFTKIPAGQEQKGDIGIISSHTGDIPGHIFIKLDGSQVIEQNAPEQYPAIHSRSNTNVLGYLRLKGGNMPTLVDDGNIDLLYLGMLHRSPSQADKIARKGQDYLKAMQELFESPEWKLQNAALKNPPTPGFELVGEPLYRKK